MFNRSLQIKRAFLQLVNPHLNTAPLSVKSAAFKRPLRKTPPFSILYGSARERISSSARQPITWFIISNFKGTVLSGRVALAFYVGIGLWVENGFLFMNNPRAALPGPASPDRRIAQVEFLAAGGTPLTIEAVQFLQVNDKCSSSYWFPHKHLLLLKQSTGANWIRSF
jgi:hypothetical protein